MGDYNHKKYIKLVKCCCCLCNQHVQKEPHIVTLKAGIDGKAQTKDVSHSMTMTSAQKRTSSDLDNIRIIKSPKESRKRHRDEQMSKENDASLEFSMPTDTASNQHSSAMRSGNLIIEE